MLTAALAQAEAAPATAEKRIKKSRFGSGSDRTSERAASAARNRSGFHALFRKELADHLHSARFIIMLLLLLTVTVISFRGALSNLQSVLTTGSDYNFLKLFTTSGDSVYSFVTFIGFLGPLFGIMLGFDAINVEQSQRTLNRLAAQPMYRDSIINAKFLAGASAIFITVFSLFGVYTACGLLSTGLVPTAEVFARIIAYALVSWLYISIWMSVSMFFSVLCKHAATSALASIAIWLFLTLFMSSVASGIANAVYPTDTSRVTTYEQYYQYVANVYKAYDLNIQLNRISPYYLYAEAVSCILNPNLRSLDTLTLLQEAQNGAVSSYLSLSESLVITWPQVIALLAIAAAFFAASYIIFMKREIRA